MRGMNLIGHYSAILAVMASACVGPPQGGKHVGRPNPVSQPQAVTDAAIRQCVSDLSHLSARYELLPNQRYGEGCSTINSIKLLGVGVPVTNVTAIQCPLARSFALWAQGPLQAAARDELGARVVRIETMGAYSCRNIIGGRSTGLSEHATANALDVSAFILSDGRRVSVLSGWHGADDERGFLRTIRAAACKQFQTVLSPDYNAPHANHFHFDMGRGPYCR